MSTIIAKIDEETLKALDGISKGRPRSETIRKALRQYIARHRLDERRKQVEAYVQSGGEAEDLSGMAEMDIEHAGRLLKEAEK